MARSAFIRSMHPKAEISPVRASVDKILALGWVGQVKIHGHRAQVHVSADPDQDPIVYNRQGREHKKLLPPKIAAELRRVLPLEKGWTAIDAEWLKGDDKLFLFDVLKLNGEPLRRLSYAERHAFLPKAYLSPHLRTLPLLTTAEKCMECLRSSDPNVEGLVFKAPASKGFDDSSIVRCRKRP